MRVDSADTTSLCCGSRMMTRRLQEPGHPSLRFCRHIKCKMTGAERRAQLVYLCPRGRRERHPGLGERAAPRGRVLVHVAHTHAHARERTRRAQRTVARPHRQAVLRARLPATQHNAVTLYQSLKQRWIAVTNIFTFHCDCCQYEFIINRLENGFRIKI